MFGSHVLICAIFNQETNCLQLTRIGFYASTSIVRCQSLQHSRGCTCLFHSIQKNQAKKLGPVALQAIFAALECHLPYSQQLSAVSLRQHQVARTAGEDHLRTCSFWGLKVRRHRAGASHLRLQCSTWPCLPRFKADTKCNMGAVGFNKNIAFESLNQIVLCNIRQLGFACWVIGNWGLIPWCPT